MKKIIAFLESFITKVEAKHFSVDSVMKQFQEVKDKLDKVAAYQGQKIVSNTSQINDLQAQIDAAAAEQVRAIKAINKIQEFLA